MDWPVWMTSCVLATGLAGCTEFVGVESSSTTLAAVDDATSTGSEPPSNPPTPGSTSAGSDEGNTTDPTTGPPPTTGDDPPPETDAGTAAGTTEPGESSGETTGGDDDTSEAATTDGETTDVTDATNETTGPPPCVQDDTEDNNSFETLQLLGAQACNTTASTAEGTLEDDDDIDWFAFETTWTLNACGSGEPVHQYQVNGPVELCATFACTASGGGDGATCVDGDVETIDGFNYCCAEDVVTLDILCNTQDESTEGYAFIRAAQGSLQCEPYSFTYQSGVS